MSFSVQTPSGVHSTRESGYSHAVRMGDLVFAAGQIALDEQGNLVGEGDAGAQAEQIFKNLRRVLEASGSGLDRIGKITVFATSLEYRTPIAEVRRRIFGEINHFPASTFVVISSLARPDLLVEIEAVAMVK